VHRCIVFVIACACGTDQPPALRPGPASQIRTVEVHAPARLEGLHAGSDALGRPLRVGCATCHSLRRTAALPTSTAELDEFHQGLTFRHGPLACGACHLVGDQTQLHTADGAPVAMRDAITLCRQCHGPQARDYDHGAHGGMTGSWDLSAGARTRNHCVDCHDPHVPAFQPTRPVLLPRDRGGAR
jgi:hypothetical protein